MADDPIRTTTFELSRADALAYQQAAFRFSWRVIVATVVVLGACGGLALLIPAEWAGPRLSLSSSLLVSIAMVIGLVGVMLVIATGQWLRARRQIGRRPLEVTLTEWPDRLEVLAAGSRREIRLADLTALSGPDHVFLIGDGLPLILPRAWFPDQTGFDDLLARLSAMRKAGTAPAEAAPAAVVAETGQPAAVDPGPPNA